MKRIFAVNLLLCVTSAFVASQATTPSESRKEQEVRKFMHEQLEAIWRGDKATVDRLTADTYIETDPQGNVLTKAQRDIRGLPPNTEPPKVDDFLIRIHRETAVVSFRLVYRRDVAAQKLLLAFRLTQVLVRRAGRWQVITEHASAVPPEPSRFLLTRIEGGGTGVEQHWNER